MLKKYKILIALIAVVLMGIIVVISIWLYGIYKNKEETLISEVERALFNAVQSYYSSENETNREEGFRPYDRIGNAFVDEIKKKYPDVNNEKLVDIWDSLRQDRPRHHQRGFKEYGPPPLFMLPNVDVKQHDITEINALLDSSLKSRGRSIKTKVAVLSMPESLPRPPERRYEIPPDGDIRRRYEITPDGDIKTRPILVNPYKNTLLFSTIENPFFYLLVQMSPQAIMSIVLVLALMAAFGYLLHTINRQNKMALLRKAFVNNMTHELKTPVATVMAAIEAVQRYGARDDKVKMDKYLDISHRELDHLSRLIERVLQLDNDGVSSMPLDKESFDIGLLARECIELARLNCPKPVTIDFIANIDPILYMGDRSHIKNVCSNLLDNAIKYSGENVGITVQLDAREDYIDLIIQDSGNGIEDKYLNDIFDMFFRVPSGNLHPVKGFGLGLSYVKMIVEKHGGHISVLSKPKEGTTFKITLPI